MTQTNFGKLEFLPSIPEALFPARVGLNIQVVNVVDLNKDGKKDIVFHMWSGNGIYPPEYYGETPDALFVYLSQSDGSYQFGNKLLFGKESVKLGASSRSSVVSDFNGDGYPDIAYAMSREDGRLSETTVLGFRNWAANTAVIMSNGDGTYRIDLLDQPEYNHSITSVITAAGVPEIMLGSPNYGAYSNAPTPGALTFEWIKDHWTSVSGLPKLTSASNLALSLDPKKIETTHIFSGMLWTYNENFAVGLYAKTETSWALSSQYTFYATNDQRDFVNWTGRTEHQNVFEVNKHKIVDLAIWETASIKITPTSTPIVLALLSGNLTPDIYSKTVYQNDLKVFNYFVGFDTTGGNLKLLDTLVQGQDTEFQSYKFKVADVNGDGYDDLISYLQDYFANGEVHTNGRINIFLNDKNGHLVRDVDFTYPNMSHKDQILYFPRVIYDDLNGDGINDLLYYSTGPSVTSPPNTILTTPFEISWGTQNPYPEVSKLLGGDASNNILTGGSKDDTIIGGFGDDVLQGGRGNDILIGDQGADQIDGGEGIDFAQFSGNLNSYSLTKNAWGFSITDKQISQSGTDSFVNVERLKFADRIVAIDLDGNAGITSKILGAVFGKDAISNKNYVGIGLHLLDAGWSYDNLAGLALEALGAKTNDQIVSLLWTNVIGTKATASDKQPFIAMLENGMSAGALAHLAADTSFNTTNINLVGLAQTGIEYIPVS